MPNVSGSAKKQRSNEAGQTNNSNCSNSGSERSASSAAGVGRARKRKRCEIVKFSDSDLESEFEDCNMEDAIAIEKKLRKVAEVNSLSDDEMRKLLQKFVKNEHVLALVTLKAEDEVARERIEATDQRAIIITDTPSVPKLTRAKARELNKTPNMKLPPLLSSPSSEIAALIHDELHSDEDDEEYTFKEDDFISDDDHNTTTSDLESNPRTPQTPLNTTDYEESPVKFSADGCFKLPLDKEKQAQEDLRIAARTRSKFCLQQTTIEDLQSEFVPPDVEQFEVQDVDWTATDQDWMQFLTDISKPLNTNSAGDDDDPINDPEYVAENIPMDAEELRNVNIPKEELNALMSELYDVLKGGGVSIESVDFDNPPKCIYNCVDEVLNTPHTSPNKQTDSAGKTIPNTQESPQMTQRINFSAQQQILHVEQHQVCVSDATISSTNITHNDYSFSTELLSAPTTNVASMESLNGPPPTIPIPTAYPIGNASNKTVIIQDSALNTNPEIIAVPIPGQPNCYQLARVIANGDMLSESITLKNPEEQVPVKKQSKHSDTRYSVPYDTNFTVGYISIKKHIYSEYMDKFENLKQISKANIKLEPLPQLPIGLTQEQNEILHQQLRIHVQMLTQSFLQTYSHPDFWKLSSKPKDMLLELQSKALNEASFRAWNLNAAVDLITKWEQELSEDNEENREMMNFMHKEIQQTNRNTRQISRFHPRVMDLILNSQVFMYPQYLPRIPFTPKVTPFHVFSPAETQLIASGLEKHMTRIRETGEVISKKAFPIVVACDRLSKDTVFGKTKRRIWDHVKMLKEAKYYNPIKYFFEHECAPPVEHKLLGFENNVVLPPIQCFKDLPLAWQKYVEKKQNTTTKEPTTTPDVTVSEQARNSYLEFVREAVGEDFAVPDNLPENVAVSVSENTPTTSRKSSKSKRPKEKSGKSKKPTALTVNVNYVFGSGAVPGQNADVGVTPTLTSSYTESLNNVSNLNIINTSQIADRTPVQQSTPLPAQKPSSPPITFNYDIGSQTLLPIIEVDETSKNSSSQRKLTDFYELDKREQSKTSLDVAASPREQNKKPCRLGYRKRFYSLVHCKVTKRDHSTALKYRQKCNLKKRYQDLFKAYRLNIQTEQCLYQHTPLVQRYYCRFKALELYTNLLKDLKMFCRNAALTPAGGATNNSASPANSNGAANVCSHFPNSILGKRTRSSMQQMLEDESATGARSKKTNRQEENLRHMLMPDTAEDANRKDAIYAFNFYEKVEEVFKASNRPEDCKKFNYILKSFDPSHEKVADLYYKLEKLFLPDHPELAQVFLTFLLPSEAAEIGKFFEHFMINNATTFINKLNVYFNKQPAQIRKIYNCLNELAEDSDVTIKKIEAKILPLLKGNQFLIDWFLQQFPQETPPERLFSAPEHINVKEVENNQSGEFLETVTDLLDSPTNEQQQSCQLRYINGRIFYGTKVTLPAKLSFMASNYQDTNVGNCDTDNRSADCVHGIREYGEKRLAASAAAAAAKAALAECNSDDNEKSEEDDLTKTLIIDTTAGEEDSSSSVETCDQAALRAHAIRLNPSYYSTAYFSAATSTPNNLAGGSNQQQQPPHNCNVKKTSLNFNEEGKISPRKQLLPACLAGPLPTAPILCNSPNDTAPVPAATMITCTQLREKRKSSPTKKSRSPVGSLRPRILMQPMVVIHEPNSAIACAKKLKSLIEEEGESEIDSKERLAIVARVKDSLCSEQADTSETEAYNPHLVSKLESTDDLEYLPEHSEVTGTYLPPSSLAESDVDMPPNSDRHAGSVMPDGQSVISSSYVDSDEDCKFDIVTVCPEQEDNAASTSTKAASTECSVTPSSTYAADNMPSCSTTPPAWTRDEDKAILIEMKLGSRNREDLFKRIRSKLTSRTLVEITARHQFLMEFLSKLQDK